MKICTYYTDKPYPHSAIDICGGPCLLVLSQGQEPDHSALTKAVPAKSCHRVKPIMLCLMPQYTIVITSLNVSSSMRDFHLKLEGVYQLLRSELSCNSVV